MNKRKYKMLAMALGLTIASVGMSDAHTRATVSVDTLPGATTALGVRVVPNKDYSVASEVHQPTGGKVTLKSTRHGHTGQGKIGYQVTPRDNGGSVQWNSRMMEATEGAEAMNCIPFTPFPPMPVVPMPTFPQAGVPPMGIDFAIPPMPGQPPAMPRFPQDARFMPQPMLMPPVMPPAFPQGVSSKYLMPHIPDTARSVSDSSGEGKVDYYRSQDGSSHGMTWSSNSSSTTRSTWPAPAQGKASKTQGK